MSLNAGAPPSAAFWAIVGCIWLYTLFVGASATVIRAAVMGTIVVSGRYQKGATVITSNKSLVTWGEVVGGESAMMMAILDRLLHLGEVFYLGGSSYRLRGKEPVLLQTTMAGPANGTEGGQAVTDGMASR